MPPLKAPRCILLDFDGVIVDSLDLHLAAWAKATHQVFKVQLENPARLKGHATRTIAHILAHSYGDPSLASTLVAVKQQILLDELSRIELIEGAREFIIAAQEKNIPLGVASNSRRNFVEPALKAANLTIAVVVCGDDVTRTKPRPDIFWECARRLDMTPQDYNQILVFEDSVHGIKAAVAAGMIPIGLTTEKDSQTLLDAGARVTCSHLGEALALRWIDIIPISNHFSHP